MEDGGKSLRRMDESVVVENLGSTLVEVANWCAWRVEEERVFNRSEVRVVGRMRYKCSLQSLTVPPLRKMRSTSPPSLVTLPWEHVCCSVRICSSRLHKQWIEGSRLWRISAYSTGFVASY